MLERLNQKRSMYKLFWQCLHRVGGDLVCNTAREPNRIIVVKEHRVTPAEQRKKLMKFRSGERGSQRFVNMLGQFAVVDGLQPFKNVFWRKLEAGSFHVSEVTQQPFHESMNDSL